MVLLLKSPEKTRSNVRSYPCISLLPVHGKVLMIMVERLQERIRGRESRRQFRCMLGLEINDAWIYVKEKVKSSACKYALGIFVDFQGAINYLSWARVLEKCCDINFGKLKLRLSQASMRHTNA